MRLVVFVVVVVIIVIVVVVIIVVIDVAVQVVVVVFVKAHGGLIFSSSGCVWGRHEANASVGKLSIQSVDDHVHGVQIGRLDHGQRFVDVAVAVAVASVIARLLLAARLIDSIAVGFLHLIIALYL